MNLNVEGLNFPNPFARILVYLIQRYTHIYMVHIGLIGDVRLNQYTVSFSTAIKEMTCIILLFFSKYFREDAATQRPSSSWANEFRQSYMMSKEEKHST